MLTQTAKDIMTREVITIRKGASIDEALRLMACHNISGLPVVDLDDYLIGIITESDVLLKGQYSLSDKFARSNPLFAPKPGGLDEAYRRAQASRVEDAMTRKVLTFVEDSLAVDIARAMLEHAVNRVPIIRDRKVVGIVSRRDIVKALSKAANVLNDCAQSDDIRTGRLIEL